MVNNDNNAKLNYLNSLYKLQVFWVSIALILMILAFSTIADAFATGPNLFNITRNFSFIAIMALGMCVVIITAGIDLSVGSVLALSAVGLGIVMREGYNVWIGAFACFGTGLLCGFVNGYLIAYVKINPFVVTLGMLSIARSLAIVVTKNAMIYEFGPQEDLLLELGGGAPLGMPNSVIVLLFLTLFFIYSLNYTAWGKHIYSIGGNEEAARLTGVNVNLVKMSAYLLSGLMAAVSAFMMVGWLGSVTNGIAMTYELKVIASTVIGGANLMGGAGGAFGAVIGAALIEIIRNGLLLAGMDPYWQGTFVGAFIILAVLIDKFKITTKK